MSDVAMPIRSATPTATGRLRSLAATTAAKVAAISRVKFAASRPMIGAASTPARPAKKVLTAQTPIETAVGLVPDRSVIAGESTKALTLSPTSVKRRTTRPYDHRDDDAGVDDDLVEGDRHPEEVEDADRLGGQARRLLDGLVTEDQRGQGRDGHQTGRWSPPP
jgi:hypothetical protein